MEQSFLLKKYGGVDLYEQATMTAEERIWWINRLAKEAERQNEANTKKSIDPPGPPPEVLSSQEGPKP